MKPKAVQKTKLGANAKPVKPKVEAVAVPAPPAAAVKAIAKPPIAPPVAFTLKIAKPVPAVAKPAPAVAKPAPAPVVPVAPAPPKPLVTTVAARIDVGLGNELFIRGEGNGLSWEKGQLLECMDPTTWIWTTTQAKTAVVFKLLLNDQVWSLGNDLTVEPGQKVEVTPTF